MAKRGTGFRPAPGAKAHFEDSGSRTNKGEAVINTAAQPYGPDGLRAVENLGQLLADRYKGGLRDTRVPWGDYGEDRWIPSAVLSELYRRWAAGENVDRPGVFVFDGEPADWDGIPTPQEETDFSYLVSDKDGLNILPDSGRGGPRNPTPNRMKGSPHKYVFVETAGGAKTYWLNTLWKPGMGPMYGPGYPVEQGPEVPPNVPAEPVKPPVAPPVEHPVTPPGEPPPTPTAGTDLNAKTEALLVRLSVLEKNHQDLANKVSRGFRAIRKGGKP